MINITHGVLFRFVESQGKSGNKRVPRENPDSSEPEPVSE